MQTSGCDGVDTIGSRENVMNDDVVGNGENDASKEVMSAQCKFLLSLVNSYSSSAINLQRSNLVVYSVG